MQVLLDRVERFIRVVGEKEDLIFQRRARMLQRDKQRRARDGGGRGGGRGGGGGGYNRAPCDRGTPSDRGTPGGSYGRSHIRFDDDGRGNGDWRERDRDRDRNGGDRRERDRDWGDRGARGDRDRERGDQRGGVRERERAWEGGDEGGRRDSGERREQRGPSKWTAGAPNNAFVAAMRVVPPEPSADGKRCCCAQCRQHGLTGCFGPVKGASV